MRLEGVETAAVVLDNGAVPMVVINDSLGRVAHRTPAPRRRRSPRRSPALADRLSADELEEISDEAVPLSEISYAPLYRRPRKIWGIGLNYVEHAEDLEEASPTDEPASFMRPTPPSSGRGR